MAYMDEKQIIFFDMDNVLVDFKSGLAKVDPDIKAQYDDDGTGKPHYDDIPHIFSMMDPMPGAIDAVKTFAKHTDKFELYILSTAPWDNPTSWTDKLEWVKKHLDSDHPGGVFYKRIVLTHNKNLCVQKNAWLIDDRIAHGSQEFGDHFIHFGSVRFPDWNAVLSHFNIGGGSHVND